MINQKLSKEDISAVTEECDNNGCFPNLLGTLGLSVIALATTIPSFLFIKGIIGAKNITLVSILACCTLATLCLFVWSIAGALFGDFLRYKKTIKLVKAGEYEILYGSCKNVSLSGSECKAIGEIYETNKNIVFYIPGNIVFDLPDANWQFSVVKTRKESVVIIPTKRENHYSCVVSFELTNTKTKSFEYDWSEG